MSADNRSSMATGYLFQMHLDAGGGGGGGGGRSTTWKFDVRCWTRMLSNDSFPKADIIRWISCPVDAGADGRGALLRTRVCC